MAKARDTRNATTPAIRRQIQRSTETTTALAARYGVNRKTIYRWRNRSETHDLPRGRPQPHGFKTLSLEEQAAIVGFRRLSRLPLDDCLYALQGRFPQLTRSTLYRCLRRFGIQKVPGAKLRPLRASIAAIGRLQINIGRANTGDGVTYIFAAADPVSRLIFVLPCRGMTEQVAARFLSKLVEALPYLIHTVETNGEAPFVARQRSKPGLFDAACKKQGIRHCLGPQDRTWLRIQRDILTSVSLKPQFASRAELAAYLDHVCAEHNFSRKLKSLGGLTPIQFACKAWATDPEQFHRMPTEPKP